MKRIVQCPKCQAKLAVFDLGKPINQKCPKCNESFVIESEEAKPADAKKEPPADAKPEAKAEATPEAKTKEEPKAEVKADAQPAVAPKPAPKPAAPKPVAAAAPEPALPEHASGVSFLHIVVIIGLLILVILMQVMAKKNAEKRFNGIEAQITDMHKALLKSK